MTLNKLILGVVVVLLLIGLCNKGGDGSEVHAPGDLSGALDFGDCTRLDTEVQVCTYKDGHTEWLKLSDMTGR